jgi:type I restriction enzyme M protein
LFRNEEKDMREKLIRSDLVECVIGLGPNLFYNSPMEACIVICRTNKDSNRKGQVLFINALNEVTRKNAQSYLEDKHIDRIADAYEKYESDGDIAKKVTIKDIEKNDFSLSIPLYIQTTKEEEVDDRTVQECYSDWKAAAGRALMYHRMIMEMLGGAKDDDY